MGPTAVPPLPRLCSAQVASAWGQEVPGTSPKEDSGGRQVPTPQVGGRPLPAELVSGSLPLAQGRLFLSDLNETKASGRRSLTR